MPKMDEDTLLSHLQRMEEDSAAYVQGSLRAQRDASTREYFRRPYGNEEEGWSQIVTSDVQDTVEWILPELLDFFISSEDAVVFDPTRESDAQGAEQATDTCNYVFYKQNDGYLVLYTAFKDALMSKNCAVHWRNETVREKETIPVRGASPEMFADILQDDDEIEGAEEIPIGPMLDMMGQPMLYPDGKPRMQVIINAKISRTVERKVTKVEAFEPENLLIRRDWTSPMLGDCPYVARIMPVSLSDLKVMGFKDVDADDLKGSNQPGTGSINTQRDRTGGVGEMVLADSVGDLGEDDESQTMGYLRIEWVLVDTDGDGIAERREVYRLQDKILSNEECSQVPIATGSPILVQHRWDGMSVSEMVADLQLLRTELTRGVVNNAYLANNPRSTVLVDSNGAPQANIDDLLDGRPGIPIQIRQHGAVEFAVTPFVGNQMFPLLEYIDEMRQQRTGVSKDMLDPNALRPDRTAAEYVMTANAAKMRVKLIARNMAETIVKPMFKGILKLLTEGDMDKLSFRLRGEFVEYDPNEWRDSYDMTINVGLGTGDKQQQAAILHGVFETQMKLAGTPLGPMLVKPKQIFTAQSKILDLAGFKNVGDFMTDPQDAPLPTPPPPPPDPKIAVKQMELQAEAQKFQAESQLEAQRLQFEQQAKLAEQQAQLELQSTNDQRDAEREMLKAQYQAQLDQAQMLLDRYKTDEDNKRAIIVARIAHPEGPELDGEGKPIEKPDYMPMVMESIASLADQAVAPKNIVRDAAGKVVGVEQGGMVRQVVRDENGRVAGLH